MDKDERPVATINPTEDQHRIVLTEPVTSERAGSLRVPKTGPKMGELEDVENHLQ
jgi:hypothetical protein